MIASVLKLKTLDHVKTAAAVVISAAVMASACDFAPTSREHESRRPPNILIFLADDHGQWAAGPYGNVVIKTPTLDRLAASGLVMTNATSPSPVCSPARTSLLTGRLPSQHGVHDFLSERPEFDRDWLAHELLLPELLQRAGYRTALIGKWHCTATSHRPYRGFDRWLSYDVRPEGWRNQYQKSGPIHLVDQKTPIAVAGPQLEHLGAAACDFINAGDHSQPFFLLFAPTDTHAPMAGHPEDEVAQYRAVGDTGIPQGESSALPAAHPGVLVSDDILEVLAQYSTAVSRQDTELARLLACLEERGELDNTLVVYTSDHGLMVGHHGLVGKANATLPQNLWDDSLRVPMVLSWRAGLSQLGTVLDIPFDHLDLFRTILDAAGVNWDADLAGRIDSPGSSLLQMLKDPKMVWRRHRFSEHGNARCVADGRFKLVCRYSPLDPRFGDELYDLVGDPRETANLIDVPEHRAVADTLQRVLDQHFARYEVAERRGIDALEQPPMNGAEPWRRIADGMATRRE